jgi:hypothetical protein
MACTRFHGGSAGLRPVEGRAIYFFLRLQRTCAQRAHVTGGVGKGPQFDCDSLHVCPEICPLVAKQPPAGYPSAGELAKISQRAIVCRARRAPMISTPDQANPGTSCLQCETGS